MEALCRSGRERMNTVVFFHLTLLIRISLDIKFDRRLCILPTLCLLISP